MPAECLSPMCVLSSLFLAVLRNWFKAQRKSTRRGLALVDSRSVSPEVLDLFIFRVCKICVAISPCEFCTPPSQTGAGCDREKSTIRIDFL